MERKFTQSLVNIWNALPEWWRNQGLSFKQYLNKCLNHQGIEGYGPSAGNEYAMAGTDTAPVVLCSYPHTYTMGQRALVCAVRLWPQEVSRLIPPPISVFFLIYLFKFKLWSAILPPLPFQIMSSRYHHLLGKTLFLRMLTFYPGFAVFHANLPGQHLLL